MRRTRGLIENVVLKNRMMSVKSLRDELKTERNTVLIRLLLQYLTTSFEEIDYSTNQDECADILRVLNYIKPENDSEFKIVEETIKKMKEILGQKKKLIINDENFMVLLNFLEERLGSFLIETRVEMEKNKGKITEFPNIDSKKLRTIICEYVFKYKDYGHLNLLLSLYPNACNIKVNEKTIVIKILKEYLTRPNEREFLSKVITLFVSNVNYQISDEEKREIAELCDRYSSILNVRDLIYIKEIMTTLGVREEFDVREKLNLLKVRYGIQDVLFDNVRLSYEHFPVNLTDRIAVTIDCSDTLIMDDAFSIEKKPDGTFELGLYITDVSSILQGSPLDIYAFHHFSTIYTRDTWVPMIPEPLVYNFSLREGLRRVIAYTFRFTPKLELIDCEIVPAMIRVRKNLTYSESLERLDNPNELYDFLRNALELSEAISDSLGTIDRYHQIKEIVRELGASMTEVPEKYLDTPGTRIISTFSIFLNNYLATRFDKSGLPFIYRVNDFESTSNIQAQLLKYKRDKVICDMLRSLQTLHKPSSFSSVNTGHKGLGLDAYTQASNPARLYVSLMIQRMIIDLFIDKIPPEEYARKYSDVESYAKEFTALQERNNRFTAEYNKLCRRFTIERK